MKVAWARTVWPASMVMTCPARGTQSVQVAQQRRELGHLVGLGAGEPLGDHRAAAVGSCGQQVGHEAVGADGAADRLAVYGDRRQPVRAGDGEDRRGEQGTAGQVGAGVIGQLLGADPGEDPHDRVRVRQREDPQGVAAAPERGQDFLTSGTHPGGDVFQGAASAQHSRRAHRQDARRPAHDGHDGRGNPASLPASA